MSKLQKKILAFLREYGTALGCHQDPSRSFFYKGEQFPVCARCTGVLVGEILAIPINLFFKVPYKIIVFLLTCIGVDWGIQYVGILESTNLRRFITGICGGIAVTTLYVKGFAKILRILKK